jgi:DNA-binding transcriptional ArsR family regulator
MQATFVIESLDQLKALADPLRQRILRAFCCDSATTMQIAGQLKEKPTRLYHHVDQLEKAGLIELVDTRQNRGTVEKYYRAVARRFMIKPDLLRMDQDQLDGADNANYAALINTLQNTLNDACNLFDPDAAQNTDPCCSVVLVHAHRALTEAQANALIDKIQDWLGEFDTLVADEEEGESGQTYTLSIALFPTRSS